MIVPQFPIRLVYLLLTIIYITYHPPFPPRSTQRPPEKNTLQPRDCVYGLSITPVFLWRRSYVFLFSAFDALLSPLFCFWQQLIYSAPTTAAAAAAIVS